MSKKFIYLRQSLAGLTRDPGAHLYRFLAARKINIEFLNLALEDENPYVACCLEFEDSVQINPFLKQCSSDIDILSNPDAGILSLYPHKHSLHVFGKILEIFGNNNHRFHQMASSGAMLTFVVDFCDQEKIAASLVYEIGLPETHTPFRQIMNEDDILLSQNKKPETSATYNESNIRTYGILEKSGLFVYRLVTDQAGLALAGKQICRLSDAGIKFGFVSAASGPDKRIDITIIAGESEENRAVLQRNVIYDRTNENVNSGRTQFIRTMTKPDLIYFQGPHFGDRHGIADRAFSTLLQNNINIISAGCVGASICIAVDAKTGATAKTVLGASFDDPLRIKLSAGKQGNDLSGIRP